MSATDIKGTTDHHRKMETEEKKELKRTGTIMFSIQMSESMKERERRTGKMRIVLWLILKPCLRDPSNRPTSLNLSTAPRSLSLEIAQHTTENREILQEIESLLAVEISDLTTPTSDKGQWPRQLGPLNVWFSSANRRYTSTLKMRPIATCKFLLSESKVSTTRNLKEKS